MTCDFTSRLCFALLTQVALIAAACDSAPQQNPGTAQQHGENTIDASVPAANDDVAPGSLRPNEAETDTAGDCPASYAPCDDRCVDLSTHPDHCGDCDNFCGRTQTCIDAECVDCDRTPEACIGTSAEPTEPEPEPEPTFTEPEPTSTEPEPTSTEPEPTSTEPEPTSTEPEPTSTEPEPTSTEPEPTSTEPEPTSTEPEPTSTEPEPTSTEPERPTGCIELIEQDGLYNSGEVGTAAACYEVPGPRNGWYIANQEQRSVTINGQAANPPVLPSLIDGKYIVEISAGEPSFLSFGFY